jgi:hypothetical protein
LSLLSPQAAGQEGTVTGALSLDGVPVTLKHVYASAQPGFFDKNTEDVRILLSDVALSDSDRADVFALIHLGRDGNAHIIEVVIDADGHPISGSFFARAFDGQVSASGMHTFTRERLERTTIAGRLYVDPPREFMKVRFAYDVHFTAPIPRPPTAAERVAALASPPGRAAQAYVAAALAGDLPGFVRTLTAAAAASYRASDGAARLKALHDDLPADSAVVGLAPQTDGTVLASVEGHRDGVVIGYTLKLVQVAGAWKVGS